MIPFPNNTAITASDGPLGISDKRLLHLRSVGRRAADLSRELFGFSPEKQRSMFVLGFLHDIGYEYTTDQRQHEHIGGDILAFMGMDGWQAIYDHGDPDIEEMSDELIILNMADMQTDGYGRPVTAEERLADIKTRYGEGSEQFVRANHLLDNLRRQLAARGKDPRLI
ncbi:HD domain-containing protein [Rothia sp. P7181]|uniref:HD domain-containing protein n=1 Tax=Rothia sp. P7181 TaxID=3402663 RepID=UPI003ADA516F